MHYIRISPTAMASLWLRAEQQGTPYLTPLSRSADLSGGCASPVLRSYVSSEDLILWIRRRQPYKRLWRFHGGASFLNDKFQDNVKKPPQVYFDASLPCRKCPVCLRRRARLWRMRALNELALSSRTWFATFTLAPQNRLVLDVRAHLSCDDTSDAAYIARHAAISRYFTLYFKRLRKTVSGLRYLLVAEAHKDGYPHYHALIHERGPMVTKRELQGQWSHGFSSVKLVDTTDARAPFYVTKYLAKQALARIRASLRYGHALSIAQDSEALSVWPPRDTIDHQTLNALTGEPLKGVCFDTVPF